MLWKVELFDHDSVDPIRWGVVVASSENEAVEIALAQMGDAQRATFTRKEAREIQSLPEGTFFWSSNNL